MTSSLSPINHASDKQQEVRREQNWNLKARLQFTSNFKHPRLSTNLQLEPQRGVRASSSKNLRDGKPNPAYIVEWVSAIQKDLMTGSALRVDAEFVVKVRGLKKSFMKHYWVCVNLDKFEKFDSEELMRAHWHKCHSYNVTIPWSNINK